MASIHACLRHLRCQKPALGAQWMPNAMKRAMPSTPLAMRTMATTTTSEPATDSMTSDRPIADSSELISQLEAIHIPHQGVTHARAVPASPSYFSQTPKFNDLHVQLARLLSKHYHLPTVPASQAEQLPWLKLDSMRTELGERIKASHFTQVMRIVRRLHCIEASLAPAEVRAVISSFTKVVNPNSNVPKPAVIDQSGRAIGVGRRKQSTARAFVVEGTGKIIVNGKTLNNAFGRVHDRESAIWALTATGRLDKYNVWALVEGGGTTGQAEALTMAVAKGMLAHEPALKPALRKAGCITRDKRRVERKLHGHLKARKSPTWVKR